MQVPLSRIEYDYVKQTFITEKPTLFLQYDTALYAIYTDAYFIQNERVYFRSKDTLTHKITAIYFNHKKRALCFFAFINSDDRYYYFDIPTTAYKHDPINKKENNIYLYIHTAKKQSLKAQEHTDYPLNAIMSTSCDTADILEKIIHTNRSKKEPIRENQLPLFWYRIAEFEENAGMLFSTLHPETVIILFIDHATMVCACKLPTALMLEKEQPMHFMIHFSVRTVASVHGMVDFSRQVPLSDICILSFTLDYEYEEDKRFLYERVYHEKYSPVLNYHTAS